MQFDERVQVFESTKLFRRRSLFSYLMMDLWTLHFFAFIVKAIKKQQPTTVCEVILFYIRRLVFLLLLLVNWCVEVEGLTTAANESIIIGFYFILRILCICYYSLLYVCVTVSKAKSELEQKVTAGTVQQQQKYPSITK